MHPVGKILFLGHLIFVVFWVGLFFVPTSFGSEKISFHFYLTLIVVLQQFIWGAVLFPWTKKYKMICFLTTIMQLARGYKLSNPKNYNHSFVSEGFKDLGIKVPKIAVTIFTFTILIVVTTQFFFFR